MNYGYSKKLSVGFMSALESVRSALADEGFGIITEIDVRDTLKKKIDVDFDNYAILGACNPKLAHRALSTEKEIGLLLPCNVIVYEDGGEVFVSAIVPSVAMSMVENDRLKDIATEVESRLMRVVDMV
jgi:uncharacterized protein (DUF302 family)